PFEIVGNLRDLGTARLRAAGFRGDLAEHPEHEGLLRLDRRAELVPGTALSVTHREAFLLVDGGQLIRLGQTFADHPLAHPLDAVELDLPLQALLRLV